MSGRGFKRRRPHNYAGQSGRNQNQAQAPSAAFLQALEAQRRGAFSASTSSQSGGQPDTASGVQAASSTNSAVRRAAPLPGFYYDEERQRYFPLSQRPRPPSAVTAPSPTPMCTDDKAALPLPRGLTRGIVERQVSGPAGLGSTSKVFDHLIATRMDMKAHRVLTGVLELQDVDVKG